MLRRYFCKILPFIGIASAATPTILKPTQPGKTVERFDPDPQPGDVQYGWYDSARFHHENETYWRERALMAERDLEQREKAIELAMGWLKDQEYKSSSFSTETHYAWHCLNDAHRPHSHEHCLNGSHREI